LNYYNQGGIFIAAGAPAPPGQSLCSSSRPRLEDFTHSRLATSSLA